MPSGGNTMRRFETVRYGPKQISVWTPKVIGGSLDMVSQMSQKKCLAINLSQLKIQAGCEVQLAGAV